MPQGTGEASRWCNWGPGAQEEPVVLVTMVTLDSGIVLGPGLGMRVLWLSYPYSSLDLFPALCSQEEIGPVHGWLWVYSRGLDVSTCCT
jgi:hypothetical protein